MFSGARQFDDLSRPAAGSAVPPDWQTGTERDEMVPPTLTQVVIAFVKRALVIGLAVSVAAHLIGLVLSMFVHFGGGVGGGVVGGLPGGEGAAGLGLVRGPELTALQDQAIELHTVGIADVMPESAVVDGGLDAPTDARLSAGGGLSTGGLGGGAGDVGAGGGLGVGTGSGGGGGGGASFFGVEAQGNRFAYIVDVSGSMGVGGKMDALREQLISSLSNLAETSAFVVFLYSDDANPLGGRKDWSEASADNKRWARRNIAAASPNGGTVPMTAFQLIFALRPRPDAIYFMTDGEFEEAVAEEIRGLNRAPRIPVHCISLFSPQAEDLMRRIAQQSGGTYTAIDAATPGRRR